MTNKHQITRAVGWISLATMISRLLGFLRDALNASLFGASHFSDAYFAAFRIPNLLRDLVAEGALSSAFIPAFTKEKESHGDAEAWRFSGLMFTALACLLSGIVLIGILLSPWLVSVLAPGFLNQESQYRLTVLLTRWLFPFIAFMAFGSLLMGSLNTYRSFFLPALAPAVMNGAIIVTGILLSLGILGSQAQENKIFIWTLGTLAGGFLQFAVMLPSAMRRGFRPVWAWPFKDPRVIQVSRLMLPAAFGLSLVQINFLVNQILASFLPEGTITILNYGNRMMQLPFGVFGVAIATAVLPSLSAHVARRETAGFRQTLAFGLRLSSFISLPCMAGLMLLSFPINQLLFHWGKFGADSTRAVAMVSMFYSTMIVTASASKVLVPAFYALREPKVPVRISLGMVALNLCLNLGFLVLLPRQWGFLGLAATTSLVSLVSAGLLFYSLNRRCKGLEASGIFGEFGRCLLAAGGMAAFLGLGWWISSRVGCYPCLGRKALGAWVLCMIAAGVGSYFFLAHLLGLEEWKEWLARRKKTRAVSVEAGPDNLA